MKRVTGLVLLVVVLAVVAARLFDPWDTGATGPQNASGTDTGNQQGSIENILAASWQPTFCATKRGQSKTECKSLTTNTAAARQFSIHGLWPDDLDDTEIFPCYCKNGKAVSCKARGERVSQIDLSSSVWRALQTTMPGVQSGLHLHEWSKHGTCYEDFNSGPAKGASPEEYFADTLTVIDQLNDSPVADLFAKNIGKRLTYVQVQATFDTAFGKGAGKRVFMDCSTIGSERHIAELRINLSGIIDEGSDLSDLILRAPTIDQSTFSRPCKSGIVTKAPTE